MDFPVLFGFFLSGFIGGFVLSAALYSRVVERFIARLHQLEQMAPQSK